jgi:hypothetical protein
VKHASEPPNGYLPHSPAGRTLRAFTECGKKERQMSEHELRRKLRAFPTGGLFFRLLTRF